MTLATFSDNLQMAMRFVFSRAALGQYLWKKSVKLICHFFFMEA